MRELARYLFLASRFSFGPRSRTCSLAAVAIAPHFFVGGRFTGHPCRLSGAWLAKRGVGTRQHRATGHTTQRLRELVKAGILRERYCDANNRLAGHVYHLQPDALWRWPPHGYELALADWERLEREDIAWGGAGTLVREIAPLLELRPGDAGGPHDERHRLWLDVVSRLVDRYGLDTLQEGVRGALLEPEALHPFEPYVFERHFAGFVFRARRAQVSA